MEAAKVGALSTGLRLLMLVLPFLLMGLWSLNQPLAALVATQTISLAAVQAEEWGQAATEIALKRKVQQHFRKYNIYIPLEDIMLKPIDLGYQENLFLLLDQTCGHGSVYVWIPLVLRFPFVGNKVMEWCWIPKIKIAQSIAD